MTIGERGRIHSSVTETVRPCAPGPRQNGQPGTNSNGGTVRLATGVAVDACERCAEMGRTCPSCVQHRRRAWSLVMEYGEARETAARIMGLDLQRVGALVAAESDRRELRSLRCDTIPVQRTHVVIAEALARDPDLRVADIARWLDMQQADFERAFLGKGRAGCVKRRVSVTKASALMIALGRAPNEIEGC